MSQATFRDGWRLVERKALPWEGSRLELETWRRDSLGAMLRVRLFEDGDFRFAVRTTAGRSEAREQSLREFLEEEARRRFIGKDWRQGEEYVVKHVWLGPTASSSRSVTG